ncbi:MAG: hypothetical protein JJU11_16765 [Candidatus Sumerlaeia bacterium]|nr:hypothetical protein [Candidatus Sumerlaeia bacterium]
MKLIPVLGASALFLCLTSLSTAQTEPREINAFYIGHSLISDIPDMVMALAAAHPDAGAFTFREQNIPGAPLRWQWDEQDRDTEIVEPTYQGLFHVHLPTGEYDTLVLTDSVPRGGPELVAESMDYTNRFAQFAWDANPHTQVVYYESWHCIHTGTEEGCSYDTVSPTRNLPWAKRLLADRPMWVSIVDHVREDNPQSPRATMAPAGTALASLVEAIDNGEVPGFESYTDLFEDDIHLNPYGKYFVACVHFATLYRLSPVGLPHEITNRWGGNYWDTPNWQGQSWSAPDPEAILQMQQIAWTVTANDPEGGIASIPANPDKGVQWVIE